MTKYQLAKLISMAGKIESRKRIQKTVFLLKAAGCPIEAEYRLHYYGPYSSDVAELLDEMTAMGILVEDRRELSCGTQYDYSLTEEARASLEEFDQSEAAGAARADLERYADLFSQLGGVDAKTLEYAATIVHFVKIGRNWGEAVEEMCRFKSAASGSSHVADAEELAKQILARGDDHN